MSKQYTQEHEWIEDVGNGRFRVGITDFAQEQLGDVVSVELPEVGQYVAQKEECAVIESVKAASDIYAPISGEVAAVNETLIDNPGLVNESPEDGGWLWEMTTDAAAEELMDATAYAAFVEEA
ncbi:glycine cleavage system protein GcvH [Candidatus Persebacteraceae bacterium Df01]|jgi:glycine cleavage system H protein|uniref:Glycine cleavage system H protein n=1 Tax=Candidatus Doriopsillibacter californiensis TaxID=2970740 RepID=A0ABT7QLX3_9GAMM|nr:glycine cleavage system protein GcvH [Candidatus Persebacteraceae bacterium Df01]